MILLTGGAGFIGSNILASLNERGVSEIAISDHVDAPKQKNIAKHRYTEIVPPEDMLRWLDGRKLDAILHLGAISSMTATDEDAVMAANFELPLDLLDWCAKAKTPFIYASSAATYGDGSRGFDDDFTPAALERLRPLSLYGWTKHAFDLSVVRRLAVARERPPVLRGLQPGRQGHLADISEGAE